VLIVDDDPMVSRALARFLRQRYEVVTAGGALDGLRLLETRAVDVVIADMCMPEMDGMELLGRVSEAQPRAVRMLLTGHVDVAVATEAVRSGRIAHFVPKPCIPDQLVAAIEQCLATASATANGAKTQSPTAP
jgi:DNA-binding NtrC family response regulator